MGVWCRREGSPHRLSACSEEPKGGSGGVQLRHGRHLQNHFIPVRTRPLADKAYYPLVDIMSAGGFVAQRRATREETADYLQQRQDSFDALGKCRKQSVPLLAEGRLALAVVSILALSWPFSTAAAGASCPRTASRRHLRTAQAWWCTARMHNRVPCQNHSQGQMVLWGVAHSGVMRHRAEICIGAQRGNAPSGQTLWHPAAH